ncbi:hypothetical protein GCM10007937_43200 [Mesorhizobium albiziae]|nr:hypothetical protein GCM10007937_43200 [Mesorhizobium albiziae]
MPDFGSGPVVCSAGRSCYWYSDDAPIDALLAYGKNEKLDLKPDEAKAVAAFATIKAANRSRA